MNLLQTINKLLLSKIKISLRRLMRWSERKLIAQISDELYVALLRGQNGPPLLMIREYRHLVYLTVITSSYTFQALMTTLQEWSLLGKGKGILFVLNGTVRSSFCRLQREHQYIVSSRYILVDRLQREHQYIVSSRYILIDRLKRDHQYMVSSPYILIDWLHREHR